MIYFYFNTEIRHEVLRQVQRTISRNETIRRSSTGETLSTRLSVFRISFSRRRQSTDKRRATLPITPSSPPPPTSLVLNTRQICWAKFLAFICPCLANKTKPLEQHQQQPELSIEHPNHQNETTPMIESNLTPEHNLADVTSPLLNHTRSGIDNEVLTCETLINKNENDDETLSDANDVTIHHSSFMGDQTSMASNNTNEDARIRSKSDGHTLKTLAPKHSVDNKSLR